MKKIYINHGIIMILCCLVPLIIAGLLYYFGFTKYAGFIVILLCPLLHYFMMKDMHQNHSKEGRKNNHDKMESMKCH